MAEDEQHWISVYADIINGKKNIAKAAHCNYGSFFNNRGYKAINPFRGQMEEKNMVAEFFCNNNEFDIKGDQLKDLYTVYKADGDLNF